MLDVVCLHGLGGTAATMAPLVDALREQGWSVDALTLPGHGTRPEDLLDVTWDEWVAAVPTARVVIGQSLGGSLALARPGTAGVVCINPVALVDDVPDGYWIEVGAADIRADGVTEDAYTRLPVAALAEMMRGVGALDLAAVTVPVLVVTSGDDGVLDPYNSDVVAAGVSGAVERLHLPRSGHVATLDVDADLLIARVTEWTQARLG